MSFNNTVSIKCNGQTLTGFQSVRISRGIENVPSTFALTVTEKDPNLPQVVVESQQPCTIMIGNDVAITGYVGRYAPAFSATEHSVTITGYSKFMDLIKDAAFQKLPQFMGDTSFTGNAVISGATINQIAEILCKFAAYKDYGGIKVTGETSTIVIPTQVLNLGESTYEILMRLCRFAQLLCYDNTNGDLVFARAGETKMASGFVQGQNVYSAAANFDSTDRYSDVYCYWQNFNTNIELDPNSVSLSNGYANDSGIKRFKPLIVISEQTVDGISIGKARAQYEVNRRYGRSQMVHVVADSWRDTAGTLWTPNALVSVDLPMCKINNVQWLIADVSYVLSVENGTTAELTLMPPEAFAIEPINIQPFNWDVVAGLEAEKQKDPGYSNDGNTQVNLGPLQ